MALGPDLKLFPHFGEAGTAIFAVEQVEYGGHDRTPSFDHRSVSLTTFLGMQEVIWIAARLNGPSRCVLRLSRSNRMKLG
jgi:hypothetical protein